MTSVAFLLLVQVKRFWAVANKTHLSVIRGGSGCLPSGCDPVCSLHPDWLRLPGHTSPGGRRTDKSRSFHVKVKVLTPQHPDKTSSRRGHPSSPKDKGVVGFTWDGRRGWLLVPAGLAFFPRAPAGSGSRHPPQWQHLGVQGGGSGRERAPIWGFHFKFCLGRAPF